jgi:hypothetical protein
MSFPVFMHKWNMVNRPIRARVLFKLFYKYTINIHVHRPPLFRLLSDPRSDSMGIGLPMLNTFFFYLSKFKTFKNHGVVKLLSNILTVNIAQINNRYVLTKVVLWSLSLHIRPTSSVFSRGWFYTTCCMLMIIMYYHAWNVYLTNGSLYQFLVCQIRALKKQCSKTLSFVICKVAVQCTKNIFEKVKHF